MRTFRNDLAYPIDVDRYGVAELAPGGTFGIPDGANGNFATGITEIQIDVADGKAEEMEMPESSGIILAEPSGEESSEGA